MEANIEDISSDRALATHVYKSRPGALIWSFRKSRDRWKLKHQRLKATVKGYKNQIADLTKSRQRWRLQAQQAAVRLAQLEAELARSPAASVAAPPRGEKSDR